jgi:outer membrane biosynthesis protein TonB
MSAAVLTMPGGSTSGSYSGLPWQQSPAEVARVRRWVTLCAGVTFVAGLVLPWLPLPEPPSQTPQLVTAEPMQIMLEQPARTPPPPPPPPPRVEPAEPAKAPAQVPQPVTRETRPEPAPARATAPEPVPDAREQAASAGLMAFQDTLATLRGAVDTGRLAAAGTESHGAPGAAATVDASQLAATPGARSAGLNDAKLSRDTGGVALAARETTRVAAPESAGSGTPAETAGAGAPRQRSIEDVRRVFDANKGAIFAIYHRALRADPALRGEVVLELVIEPGGRVAELRVVASELQDPALLERLLGRIRMFDFGARDVAPTRISYPVHFLPG